MAIYHFSMKTISRGKGRSVTAAAAYRSASRIHDERTDRTHDYLAKRGVLSSVILAPSRAPEWARTPETLWNQVEQVEKRKDARLARENIVALPHELSVEDNVVWLHRFVQDHYVKRGMVAQVSVHGAEQESDPRNMHAHILLTDRQVTRNGFKEKKVRSWNDKATLMQWREAFADRQNEALREHGFEVRVDHRSYRDQGLEREPSQHLGPAMHRMEQEEKQTFVGERNREAMKRHSRLLEIQMKQERKRMQDIRKRDLALRSAVNDRVFLQRKQQEVRAAELEARKQDHVWGRLTKQKEQADELLKKLQAQETRLQKQLGESEKFETEMKAGPHSKERNNPERKAAVPLRAERPRAILERTVREDSVAEKAPLPCEPEKARKEAPTHAEACRTVGLKPEVAREATPTPKASESPPAVNEVPVSEENMKEQRKAEVREQIQRHWKRTLTNEPPNNPQPAPEPELKQAFDAAASEKQAALEEVSRSMGNSPEATQNENLSMPSRSPTCQQTSSIENVDTETERLEQQKEAIREQLRQKFQRHSRGRGQSK